MDNKHLWIDWAAIIKAITQNGITFRKNPFDLRNYQELQAISAEIITNFSNLDYQEVLELFSKENGYITPKIALRAGIFKDNKILLVKKRADNKWALSGGWADIGLTPAQNILREIVEEIGYTTRILKLALIYDNRIRNDYSPEYPYIYALFFICEIIKRNPLPNLEISEIEFFSETNLPILSYGKTSVEQVKLLFRHYEAMNLLTEFD